MSIDMRLFEFPLPSFKFKRKGYQGARFSDKTFKRKGYQGARFSDKT